MKNLNETINEVKKESIPKMSAEEFKEKYNIKLDKRKFSRL